MKRILILLAIFASVLTSCTHNDGDIGNLFGVWRLERMSCDGDDVTLYNDRTLLYTWSFQSDVVLIETLLPHNDTDRAFGSWSRYDDTLILNFSHYDSGDYANYTPPAELMLNSDGVTQLNIIQESSSKITLRYTDASGHEVTYYLNKTR